MLTIKHLDALKIANFDSVATMTYNLPLVQGNVLSEYKKIIVIEIGADEIEQVIAYLAELFPEDVAHLNPTTSNGGDKYWLTVYEQI